MNDSQNAGKNILPLSLHILPLKCIWGVASKPNQWYEVFEPDYGGKPKKKIILGVILHHPISRAIANHKPSLLRHPSLSLKSSSFKTNNDNNHANDDGLLIIGFATSFGIVPPRC